MKVPFTWKPTGWFMIGFSADFVEDKPTPLKYFGQDLVGYRKEDGSVVVLKAHCPHLGAHLGFGGKINGDCIECPYHGWGFDPDGINKYIPYQDEPNVSKSLKSWPTQEQHEWVFMWHDPAGGPPRWELPEVWNFDDEEANPDDFYRAYPELSIKYEGEPVHPQIPLENGPDSVHFEYVHNATVTPELLDWEVDGNMYRTHAGWPVPNADGTTRLALSIRSTNLGVSGSYSRFTGSAGYRLAFFTTPVDDESSDMWYSIWWPKDENYPGDIVPDHYKKKATEDFLITLRDDLEIWRHQVYVSNPALAKQDAKPYGALRKWAKNFYEVEPV